MTKENKKIIASAVINFDTCPRHKLDNVEVFPGAYKGIEGVGLADRGRILSDEEIMQLEEEEEKDRALRHKGRIFDEKWVLARPAKRVLEGRIGCTSINHITEYGGNPLSFLAGVPGHCRILSGEKALNTLIRKGYEPLTDFFRRAVEKYEGRKI